MNEINEREAALLDVIAGGTPMCPYLFQVPAQGAHGPQTCPGGCVDEPCTTSGPFPVFAHRDLVDALRVVLVAETIDHVPADHPAHAWWAEHTEKACVHDDPTDCNGEHCDCPFVVTS